MKMRISSAIVIAGLVSGFGQHVAYGWGQYGHQQINDAAITLLGESTPLGKCLSQNRYLMKRYAITPDAEWKLYMPLDLSDQDRARREENNRYEHPLHYFEADAFLMHPGIGDLARFPVGEYSSVFPFLKSQLEKNASSLPDQELARNLIHLGNATPYDVSKRGSAPWRSLQLYRLAVHALTQKDIPLALFYLGTLGHYVGDLAQPFHATFNFDGQFYPTQALGIHHQIDSRVLPHPAKDENSVYPGFDKTEKEVLRIARKEYPDSGSAGLQENQIVGEIYKIVDSGYPDVEQFLKIYSGYLSEVNPGLSPLPEEKGLSRFDEYGEYGKPVPPHLPPVLEKKFRDQIKDTILQRLGISTAILARMWLGAYQTATTLSLGYRSPQGGAQGSLQGSLEASWDQCGTVTFSSVYSIRNYPRPTLDGQFGYLLEESISPKSDY